MNSELDVITYSSSKKVKLLFIAFILPMIAIGLWAVYDGLTGGVQGNDRIIFLVGGVLSIIFLVQFAKRVTGKYVVEIHKDKIVSQYLSEKEEIYFANIQGYKIDTESGVRLFLISKDDKEQHFNISIEQLENSHEILQWAELNFANLDKLEHDEEIEKIETDVALGRNKDERIQNLKLAKIWGRVLNGTAIILSIFTMVYPHPYEILLLLMLGFPFYVLGFIKYHHGLLKIDDDKGGIYADVIMATVLPFFALGIRGLSDWDVLSFLDLLVPMFIAATVVFVLFYANFSKENRKLKYAVIFYIPFLAYGLGTVIIVNGILIDESPTEYDAVIIEKSIGKSGDKFYFDVDSFAEFKEPDKFDVSEEIFNKFEEGDIYPIKIQIGRLGIPWIVKE